MLTLRTTSPFDACRCGDPRVLHEHYRRGSDCAADGCNCRGYRRAAGVVSRPVLRVPVAV